MPEQVQEQWRMREIVINNTAMENLDGCAQARKAE